jgi:hypothetical protein
MTIKDIAMDFHTKVHRSQENKRRKVIQISSTCSIGNNLDHGTTPLIYALCDDGVIYRIAEVVSSNIPTEWCKLPEIPQD